MKRFHVHVHVDDLAKNIAFYSAMFNEAPARTEADYAKWMLQDPPVNFAISSRGHAAGIDHLGIQVDRPEELVALRSQAARADAAIVDDGETTCCYARSDKHWITDPQGIAWEQFHTLDSIPVFSESASGAGHASGAPAGEAVAVAVSAVALQACCAPRRSVASAALGATRPAGKACC
jgi:lactoylglutathione lyase